MRGRSIEREAGKAERHKRRHPWELVLRRAADTVDESLEQQCEAENRTMKEAKKEVRWGQGAPCRK